MPETTKPELKTPEPKEKKEPTLVVSRLTKTGVKTMIAKQVGNQISKLREKIEQMKKVPELAEIAAENVNAMTKLMGFVDLD